MSNNRWFNRGEGDCVVQATFVCYIKDESAPRGFKIDKSILAKIVTYKDYDNPEQYIESGLKLYRQLREVYQEWPDGDVSVSIAIKEEF